MKEGVFDFSTMSHNPRARLAPGSNPHLGDTTLTKVFVGGLAWETQRETMRRYFEQFGEILEAVVITDKNTGRSKGYGFVTFRDTEAAGRACADPTPVIDGRRTNCNLASLGARRSRPSTPQHYQGSGSRMGSPYVGSSHRGRPGYSAPSFRQPFPYYGYPYSLEYMYPTNYYNMYMVPPFYGGAPGATLYPYAQQGYRLRSPQLMPPGNMTGIPPAGETQSAAAASISSNSKFGVSDSSPALVKTEGMSHVPDKD